MPHQIQPEGLDALPQAVEALAAGVQQAEQVVTTICDQLRRIDEQLAARERARALTPAVLDVHATSS